MTTIEARDEWRHADDSYGGCVVCVLSDETREPWPCQAERLRLAVTPSVPGDGLRAALIEALAVLTDVFPLIPEGDDWRDSIQDTMNAARAALAQPVPEPGLTDNDMTRLLAATRQEGIDYARSRAVPEPGLDALARRLHAEHIGCNDHEGDDPDVAHETHLDHAARLTSPEEQR